MVQVLPEILPVARLALGSRLFLLLQLLLLHVKRLDLTRLGLVWLFPHSPFLAADSGLGLRRLLLGFFSSDSELRVLRAGLFLAVDLSPLFDVVEQLLAP